MSSYNSKKINQMQYHLYLIKELQTGQLKLFLRISMIHYLWNT